MLTMASITLAACSSSPKEETAADKSEQVSEKETEKKEITKKESKKEETVKFEPQLIYDQNGLKVTVTGFDKDSFSFQLKMNVENSTDTNYDIQARDVSVNGLMIDPMMSIDVAAGKKANDDMELVNTDLKKSGIDVPGTIDFRLHIFNSDDYMDNFDSDIISVKIGDAKNTDVSKGDVLVDQNGIKIVSTGLNKDDLFGDEIGLYLENNSEQPVVVQMDNLSVNGYMIDGLFSCELQPGKKAVDEISMMKSDLENNEIENIEQVECSFKVINPDSYQSIFETDIVQINY